MRPNQSGVLDDIWNPEMALTKYFTMNINGIFNNFNNKLSFSDDAIAVYEQPSKLSMVLKPQR